MTASGSTSPEPAPRAVIAKDGHAASIEQPAAFNRGLLDFLAR